MTRVDFYVLTASDEHSRWQFVCRLVEKAVSKGNKIMIATDDQATSETLDTMLWEHKPESFIPHHVIDENCNVSQKPPVVISHKLDDVDQCDVLVNIRSTRPEQFSRFDRLIEIVVQKDDVLENTRKNFAFYKKRGYPVQTHKL